MATLLNRAKKARKHLQRAKELENESTILTMNGEPIARNTTNDPEIISEASKAGTLCDAVSAESAREETKDKYEQMSDQAKEIEEGAKARSRRKWGHTS